MKRQPMQHVVPTTPVAKTISELPPPPVPGPTTIAVEPATPAVAPLPPEPTAPTEDDIRARYGWVVPPEAGWPTDPTVISALLGIPPDILALMQSLDARAHGDVPKVDINDPKLVGPTDE